MSEKIPAQNTEQERKELLRETTAYINAGGRGTRLESLLPKGDKGIAKALIPFHNDPILEYHIERLHRAGFGKVIVGAGDHTEVREFVEKNWTDANDILVTTFERQGGTGGDLIRSLRETEQDEKRVIVQNVDTLLDVDEADVIAHHAEHGGATIVLTTRKGVPNEGAFYVDQDDRVVFNKEASPADADAPTEGVVYRGSSTGMVVIDIDELKKYTWESGEKPLSLYKDILGTLAAEGKLYAYNNSDRFFVDIGTPKEYARILRHPILKDILEKRSGKNH